MKKVFLTGGSGFLGSHVAEQLSKQGVEVRALVRRSSDTSFLRGLPGVELCFGSMSDKPALARAIEGCDGVVHSAGLVKALSPTDFHQVNAVGTELLGELARDAKTVKRFVFVSSLTAAGPSNASGDPVSRDSARPVTYYGRSKLAAERYLQRMRDDLPITILRPCAIYGPRDKEILAFFKALNNGLLPYMGSPMNKVSMAYGADVASACIKALTAEVPSGSVYYVDDGIPYTFQDMVRAGEVALGKRAWLRLPLPQGVIRGAAFASELFGKVTNQAVVFTRDKCNELFEQWVSDSSDTRRDLGWRPEVQFDEGAKFTVDWYRTQKML